MTASMGHIFRLERPWYRASCAVMAGLLAFMFSGKELSEAHAATRTARDRQVEWARRLGIDATRLTDYGTWTAEQKRAAAAKRQQALLELRGE